MWFVGFVGFELYGWFWFYVSGEFDFRIFVLWVWFWDVLGCLDVVELVRFGISWGLCCCGGLVCLIAYFGGCLGGFGFWDVFGRWFWLVTSCLVLLSLGFRLRLAGGLGLVWGLFVIGLWF